MAKHLLLILLSVAAAVAETNHAVRLRVELQDGSRVIGDSTLPGLPVETSFGKSTIPIVQVVSLQLADGGTNVALRLRNGDKLTGVLGLKRWEVNTVFGAVAIRSDLVRTVTIGRSQALPGLLLYYSFDQDAKTVTDESGNEHSGTLDNVRWIPVDRGANRWTYQTNEGQGLPRWVPDGRRGGAFRFASGEQVIRVPDHAHWKFGREPFTIALWVRLDQSPDVQREHMMVGHDSGAEKWGFEFFHDGLCFHINGQRTGSHRIAFGQFAPELQRWYHLAVTREDQNYRIYVDGELLTSDTNGAAVPDANADLTIGQAENIGTPGTLDEVMIFSRALSAAEISGLATAK
jgi:hypothetical protein